MNHPEISGTLEQLSLGRHEEENLVKDSHLGDKKYHYLFLRALSKGLSSLFTGSSEEFERRNRSSGGLPMSALQPLLTRSAGLGPGAGPIRHAQESAWLGFSFQSDVTHSHGPHSTSSKSSVLLWSEQLFLDTHLYFSEKVTAFLIEVPLILYSCQNPGHLPDF